MTGEPPPLAADQAGPAAESVRPVTDEDRVWANLADELTPAKSPSADDRGDARPRQRRDAWRWRRRRHGRH